MNVSLCGPHSFDTSTLGATVMPACPVQVSGPFAARIWYFAHHVGLSPVLVCATTGAAERTSAPTRTLRAYTRAMRILLEPVSCGLYARRRSLGEGARHAGTDERRVVRADVGAGEFRKVSPDHRRRQIVGAREQVHVADRTPGLNAHAAQQQR